MGYSLSMRIPILFLVLVSTLSPLGPSGTGTGQLSAQGSEELRLGMTFGGISFVGFVVETRWGNRSVELNIGTWTLRDLSVSLVGKQYLGPGDFRPMAGLGVWAVVAPRRSNEEQTGVAFMIRAPVGMDWNVDAKHHFGAHLSVNRALWIRRKDPQDETPPTDRLIPLPGFYYLWKR